MKSFLLLFFLISISCNAQIVKTIAGNGISGYIGDGSSAMSAELNYPCDVIFDHSGNMYISDRDNNVIRKINTSGIITTVVGNGYGAGMLGIGGYTGDGGPATAAELFGPQPIVFDFAGNLYIDDEGNNVIRKVSTSGIITTIAGGGTSGLGDGGPATSAQLYFPNGLVFDNVGNLYISDEGHSRVRKVNSSGIITTFAGNGTNGYSGDGGPATTAQIRQPCFLAFSPSGDLYIPDWENHRVRKVNTSGIISTVAGNGGAGDTGDGGQATDASISGCEAVLFDDTGNYFISNGISCSIRKVNMAGFISTICGNDTCSFSGDDGPATSAEIDIDAICSAIDASGNLYFADAKNNRIRRITYNATAINNVPNPPQNITIYPNPAHDEITITAPGKIESITITNLIGQAVASPPPLSKGEGVLLNVSGYAAGVYFIKVNGGRVGKFVKE